MQKSNDNKTPGVECSIYTSNTSSHVNRIAIVGTHPPKLCGLATFAADLSAALQQEHELLTIDAYAIDDADSVYADSIVHRVNVEDVSAYKNAARIINRRGYDILSIQHEYGIYGGRAGEYLLELVRHVNMPVVTTLHTVLSCPDEDQHRVLGALLELSTRIVVMSLSAIDILSEVHKVDLSKVDYIPHGIPIIRSDDAFCLQEKHVMGSPMLLTFGLLSPDKGIEHVIRALPRLLQDFPDAKYWIVGATHPNVKAWSGDIYREFLHQTAESLGVQEHVKFVNAFVPLDELVAFLASTDFYLTPYLNPMQITSGTLAYSMGAGKVVISTPYAYAQEVLAEGRGILVPFSDPEAIAEAVSQTFADPGLFAEIALAAEAYGSEMKWQHVAPQYMDSFNRALRETRYVEDDTAGFSLGLLPEVSLTHLQRMTDDTGMLQHARFATPLRAEGYCVDDNARALIAVLTMSERDAPSDELMELESRYLAFLNDALNPTTNRFRNFMSYQRDWLENEGSEDSQGRTLWALGIAAGSSRHQSHVQLSQKLFDAVAPKLLSSTSPRAWSYVILGCAGYLKGSASAIVPAKTLSHLSHKLNALGPALNSYLWPWPEERLSYANARIPQALIVAGSILGEPSFITKGLNLLRWLIDHQTSRTGCFSPVGCLGASAADIGRSHFDQQPIEASSSVSACLEAYRVTGSEDYLDAATWCFQWFLGRNDVGLSVALPLEGSCYDGLLINGVNLNQGAESTLSYLCALQELRVTRTPVSPIGASR